ncbi:MAG TPA: type II secretion system protein [Patescibacteria group bacterium]|nr:type II secretion system protein [Patescibacteria group bacterium]
MKIRKKSGQALIELLVTLALASIILPGLMTGFLASRNGQAQQAQRLETTGLLREAEEAVRTVREASWSAILTNGTYHPTPSGSTWALAPGAEVINGYTRQIVISDTYRDSSGNIATSGGTLDPFTKKITSSVTWGTPFSSTVSSVVYLTRYINNTAYLETTQADFNGGTFTSTTTQNTSGGEVVLAPNNKGKWCSPAFSSSTINLPDGPPVAVAATASASSINTPNDVFVATAQTASTSGKLSYLTVSANIDPPIATLGGIFTLDSSRYSAAGLVPPGSIGLDNNFKTNDVAYYKSSSGKTYALLATTKPDKEVIAVLVNDNNSSDNNDETGEYQDHTNKIFKYWTYYDTQMYPLSGSSNTGFMSPSANAADSGGDGNGYEGSPNNAYTNNNSYATDTNSGNGTGTNCAGADKDKHRFYNYGITVPSGTTVNGIQVQINAKADSTTGTPFICVQLSWDGGSTWTSTKSTANLTTSNATYTLGTSSDNWGHTWSASDLSDTNFRVRIIDVASNNSRDFSLDYVGVKSYYTGGIWDDQAPFDYGATSLTVLGDTGYVTSGGYLYAFNLADIDSKSTSNGLDQVGCRIQLDGYDCKPNSGQDKKYDSGETGTNSWSDTANPAHNDCSDGGNIELYADNDIYPVKVGSNTYLYVAVGAGTNPELDIVNATNVPDGSSSPSVSSATCGRASGGNAGWKLTGSLDFNTASGTEEAANSVFASPDGTRAYISSNGGIDANHDGVADSKQFYIINTSNKSSPAFLSGTSSPTSGYYLGTGANGELYPRRSMTVLNGSRAVLVGKDGVSNSTDAPEYQVLNISNEASPAFCGSLNFNQGFSGLASVSEADGDNFVYMVANTGGNDLKIVEGGPDGIYPESGTYISPTIDLGSNVAINRITDTSTVPANTSLSYQVGAAPAVNGSCNGVSFVYVGPDGTSGTSYSTGGGQFPFSGPSGFQNPARCVSYKMSIATTDYNTTPTLSDMTINYSP